ncbi:hypothetical protein [Pleomorphomonas oryzae]|uniref:hypothetical protein n=1 Tax=Pleomorphomonas oryzae TaxID=261934 RepID=UPI000406CF09|nr:hypothetical protein [Pleomorphomonas oryzae]
MKTTPNSKSRLSRSRRWLVFAAVAVVLGGGIKVGLSALTGSAIGAQLPIPAGAHFSSWADNGKDGERVVQLVRGALPVGSLSVSGVVESDSNCTPDAQGISHCNNIITLANGSEIEVIHNHAMMDHECLAPGQKLSLSKLDGDWLVARGAS